MPNLYGVEPLMPAYGRDYTSKAKAQADFDAGMDFQTASGSYTSKSELYETGVRNITLRYGRNRKVASLDATPVKA